MAKKLLRGIIFDMDGVLCLSEPFIVAAASRMFAETHKLKVKPRDFAPFVGTGEDRFIGGVATKYGVKLKMPRDKARTYKIYLELIRNKLKPLPGARRLIAQCRRRGLSIAVATSADRVKLDGNLREIGLPLKTFDASVNGDEIKRKKPFPDIFLLAAKRLGLKPAECLVIEDAPSGVKAAKAGGFQCLAVTTTFGRKTLKAAGAKWVATDLRNVPAEVVELMAPAPTSGRARSRLKTAPTITPKGTAKGTTPVSVRRATKRTTTATPMATNGHGLESGAQQSRQTDAQQNETDAQRPVAVPLKILFVASECAPFAKSGGLGDVVAGLSKELRRLGHDARILMPLYGFIDPARYGLTYQGPCCIHMGSGGEQWAGIYAGQLDNEVPVWFLDFELYFGGPHLYDGEGDALRFGLLSKAALQVCKDNQFTPAIMHLHDWMAAAASVYLKTWDRVLSPLSATASVLTIHNIGYQGKFPATYLPQLGIGWEHFTPDKFEDFGTINLLKAGIHFSDALTTVSPTHAREIREPLGGMGLAPYVNARADDFFGILNGVDYAHWNPETDKLIPANYAANNLAGKFICKEQLQKRFGLDLRRDVPLFGMISRFAAQKGFELAMDALRRALRDMELQVVVLGSGDKPVEDFFRALALQYPRRVGVHIGYANDLSHVIEAGADFFVMPSLYEPCGLNQIYSLKYGTLPVVRATGGLDDTIENYVEARGAGTGFKFWAPTADALYYSLGLANATWWDRPQHIQQMQVKAMGQDFSWAKSAAAYVEVYRHAIVNRGR